MTEVTIRDLRNRGGAVVDRVAKSGPVTITRDGEPVAELRPLARRPLSRAALLERWSGLPDVDAVALRRDLDEVLDQAI